MNHVSGELGCFNGQLAAIYEPVKEQLARVEKLLVAQLSSEDPFIERLSEHGFRLGGKRLRPALVLLTGQALGQLQPSHEVVAAAIELIHMATLAHDDVLDEAVLRRHLETINARWDNETSVLFGDYLFTRAICLVCSLSDPAISTAVAESGRIMCEGELRQVANRGNFALSEKEYLEIIAAKTGELYACACQLGAYCAGAQESQCRAMADFGRYLGTAFQIVDDVLDMLGDESTTGKSLGTDLKKQKLTLPVIRLLQQLDETKAQELIAELSSSNGDKRQLVRIWLERTDALEYCRQKARKYIEMATERLPEFSDRAVAHSFDLLCEFVLNRDF